MPNDPPMFEIDGYLVCTILTHPTTGKKLADFGQKYRGQRTPLIADAERIVTAHLAELRARVDLVEEWLNLLEGTPMPTDLTGRDLDAAIHEGVMGRPTLCVHGQVYDFESSLQVDRYSTDANAARLVLQEIERRGVMCKMLDAFWDLYGDEATAPEAICRAALAAVEGAKG